MSEHTPWKTEPCKRHQGCTDVVTLDDVFIVCVRGDKPEVAAQIVRDHNAHDTLVAACEGLIRDIECLDMLRHPLRSVEIAQAALNLAKGK